MTDIEKTCNTVGVTIGIFIYAVTLLGTILGGYTATATVVALGGASFIILALAVPFYLIRYLVCKSTK